jgi:exopolysaccharide biosynthesis polyprenyl glycosylphosphotransferase
LLKQDDGKKISRLLKRAIDIIGSVLALLLFSPALLIIAVAVKLTSKGPVLFRQQRMGQYGRRFTFLKFRSMKCVNDPSAHQDYVKRFIAGEIGSGTAGPEEKAIFKITDDPRVTRLGRFLRKSSLDELPQFINVLRGEMSLVGPRPSIPYELQWYKPWHRRRVLDAKPGITGLWQVHGRSKTTFDEMVRLDLRYAGTWSPWLDIKILLQTPRAVLFSEGAY